MRPNLAAAEQMTIEEFLAFYDARPDGERWELIEGAAIMSPAPTEWHQVIAGNILAYLLAAKRERNASWIPLLGVGTRVPVSPNSLPQPDVFVKAGAVQDKPVTDDALVLFEVLSRSNTKADQAWRRRVYASVPNCLHYVTVSALMRSATRYDRATGWQSVTWKEKNDAVDLPAIDVSIPLVDAYRFTPFG